MKCRLDIRIYSEHLLIWSKTNEYSSHCLDGCSLCDSCPGLYTESPHASQRIFIKTVRNPDPHVEKALKKLGLKYKVDEDGEFKLVFAVEGNRSTTETLGKMEIREVWSPIAKFASNPPCDLSLELLEKDGKAQKRLLLISGKAPAEEFGSMVRVVARTADESEMAIAGNDDF